MKKVILNLGTGTLARGCETVLGEILEENQTYPLRFTGSLPAATSLAETQRAWQQQYYARHQDQALRIQVLGDEGGIRYSQTAFVQLSTMLIQQFNAWLDAPEFRSVEQVLRTELERSDDVQIILETADEQIRKLPWHLWRLFTDYPRAEITFGSFDWRSLPYGSDTAAQARVLAVFGNGEGLNLSPDLMALSQLPNTQLDILKSPSLSDLHDRLWQPEGWDIFFFAGHSQTKDGAGVIDLNDRERLSIEQIKYALSKAIENGLKIAIFNSCDGLGLAKQVSELQIPYVVVMREPVPDAVAQQFLHYLLRSFSAGASFHLAVREARSRLAGLENESPGASWLPIIWQNPTAQAIYWQDLQRVPAAEPETDRSWASWRSWAAKSPALKALAVGALVMGIRALRLLEPLELASYDQLMRQRPAEPLDERIVVVEISQAATSQYGYPLSDEALTTLLDKVIQAEPLAVGLDVHRAKPNPAATSTEAAAATTATVSTAASTNQPALAQQTLTGGAYERFLQQIRETPNLFVVCVYSSSDENYGAPTGLSEQLLEEQVGFSDLPIDGIKGLSDSRAGGLGGSDAGSGGFGQRADVKAVGSTAVSGAAVRRHLLSYGPGVTPAPSTCTTPYSLSFVLAYEYLLAEGVAPIDVTENDNWRFGSVEFHSLPKRFGAYQDLELDSEIMLNYRTGSPAQRVTMAELLSDTFDLSLLQDKLVLVGYTAPVSKDYFETPYGPMAGLWVHANAVSQMLGAVLDGRSLIGTLPQWGNWQWGDWLWVIAWGWGGGYLGNAIQGQRRWLMLVVLGGLSLYGVCWLALLNGLWLPLVPSAIAASGTTIWQRLSRAPDEVNRLNPGGK